MQQKSQKFISNHEDLEAYQIAFDAAMEIFELSKNFPKEEKYSLIDPSGSQSLMGETPRPRCLTKFDVLRVQCALIWQKLGGEDVIKLLLFLS